MFGSASGVGFGIGDGVLCSRGMWQDAGAVGESCAAEGGESVPGRTEWMVGEGRTGAHSGDSARLPSAQVTIKGRGVFEHWVWGAKHHRSSNSEPSQGTQVRPQERSATGT